MSKDEQNDRRAAIGRELAAWSERISVARNQKQPDVEEAAVVIVAAYNRLSQSDASEPEVLVKANSLRKRIESAEQHRTMASEHGLNDEAIDVTYEIQSLEKELVELVRAWKEQVPGI